ncbi:hypothetical protein [Jeotgalibacillus soli]|uniref:Zinc-finger domain-containing protein n=1 Tax=Jeotgalibacillus soli TaxID=889306 RepID=A0A0C2RP58_9BACL|nr:hypothetical protein [Jeotgalibacillus soli]KIL52015.1 hypothetical protein KP78_03850 [Jeotgalibacillus soli]
MIHYSYQHWDLYVKGHVTPSFSEEMEDHLLICDQCLMVYEAAAEQFTPLRVIDVEEQVMTAIAVNMQKAPVIRSTTNAHVKRKTVAHFFISAAAAVMLASTGVFTSIIDKSASVHDDSLKEAPSITTSLMEQTERLLSQMDPAEREESE